MWFVVYIFQNWRLIIIQEFFNLIGDLPYYHLIAVSISMVCGEYDIVTLHQYANRMTKKFET